jgi:hypothetical protein
MTGLRGIEPELPTHAKRERVEVAEIERRGGCACGQLTFHTRGEPLRVGLCHCLTCRKTSGSAFNAFAIFPDDRVEITGAMEGWRASPDSERCFCPRCGSQVLAREGGETEIRLGAFDEPNLFTPTYEAWIGRRERWLRLPGLTGYRRNRLDGTPGAPSEA